MNTRGSVAFGWGILCLAGGGAYYFAKRSINSDRAERAMAEEQRRQQRERLRGVDLSPKDAQSKSSKDGKRAPNAEKVHNGDPAPVDHAHGPQEESKYEAKEVFRSKKGDRFSSSILGGK
jgi:hypothetical protein